jgi:hypothetical protein
MGDNRAVRVSFQTVFCETLHKLVHLKKGNILIDHWIHWRAAWRRRHSTIVNYPKNLKSSGTIFFQEDPLFFHRLNVIVNWCENDFDKVFFNLLSSLPLRGYWAVSVISLWQMNGSHNETMDTADWTAFMWDRLPFTLQQRERKREGRLNQTEEGER